LTGKVALVTGARIKIGMEIALILLRNGARVIVTTRFPKNAAQNYS
jgi:NAD(P)-dependent dehydrogenase (short-subunit alcohol dehydrogenase family)